MGIIDTLLAGVAGTFGVIFISGLVWNFLDAEAGQRIWWRILIVFVVVVVILSQLNNFELKNLEQAEETRVEESETAYNEGYSEGYEAGIMRVKEEFSTDIEDLLFYVPDADDVENNAYTFGEIAKKLREFNEEVWQLVSRLNSFG